jgi:hypothetical protein
MLDLQTIFNKITEEESRFLASIESGARYQIPTYTSSSYFSHHALVWAAFCPARPWSSASRKAPALSRGRLNGTWLSALTRRWMFEYVCVRVRVCVWTTGHSVHLVITEVLTPRRVRVVFLRSCDIWGGSLTSVPIYTCALFFSQLILVIVDSFLTSQYPRSPIIGQCS